MICNKNVYRKSFHPLLVSDAHSRLPKERINRLVQTIATILLSVEVVVRSGKLYDLVKKAFGFRL